jgi:hypothetical protein
MVTNAHVPLDDATLRARFSDGSLPPAQLGHREHVRLGWVALATHDDFALAAASFRRTLRGYASAIGADGKYHETITWAWLALIQEAMDGRADQSSTQFLAAKPELLDQRTLASVYDVSATAGDPIARRIFVLPRRSR